LGRAHLILRAESTRCALRMTAVASRCRRAYHGPMRETIDPETLGTVVVMIRAVRRPG